MNPKRLFVGNLSYSVDETELWGLFSRYGEVRGVRIIEGKGYGFVEMDSYEDARNARNSLNETEFKGRNLLIDDVRPPQRKSSDKNRSGNKSDNRRDNPQRSHKTSRRTLESTNRKTYGTKPKSKAKNETSSSGKRTYPEKKLTGIQRPEVSRTKVEKTEKIIHKPSHKSKDKPNRDQKRFWPGGRRR